MITTTTAAEIANKNKSLADAGYCLKNLDKCVGFLTIVIQNTTVEVPVFGDIKGFDLGNILEAVIDNINSRLDELNTLAVQEAQE